MNKFIIFSMLLGAVSTSYALDESLPLNQHVGPYAEINAGPNFYSVDVFSSSGTIKSSGFKGFGWSAAGGYNFTNIFALEGGFMQNYAQFRTSYHVFDQQHREYKYYHVNAPYVTTRFNIPIGDRFSFIGKIGAMNAMVPGKTSVVLPFVGVGASYALTRSMDLTVQYQGAVYGVWNAGLLSGGLVYHF